MDDRASACCCFFAAESRGSVVARCRRAGSLQPAHSPCRTSRPELRRRARVKRSSVSSPPILGDSNVPQATRRKERHCHVKASTSRQQHVSSFPNHHLQASPPPLNCITQGLEVTEHPDISPSASSFFPCRIYLPMTPEFSRPCFLVSSSFPTLLFFLRTHRPSQDARRCCSCRLTYPWLAIHNNKSNLFVYSARPRHMRC